MFTGCVTDTGKLHSRESIGKSGTLKVITDLASEVCAGDSIAVNGACLTVDVIDEDAKGIVFHTLAETLSRTNLGKIAVGSAVNLERALSFNGRLDGHLVSGHIDGVAAILSAGEKDEDHVIEIELPDWIKALVIEKGSIAVDGVSLTIASLTERSFFVHVIPYTLDKTNLSAAVAGTLVNLEADVIGKYVLRANQIGLNPTV